MCFIVISLFFHQLSENLAFGYASYGLFQIVKDLGYDMTLNQFMEVLRNDSKHYYDSKDEVLLGFKEIVEKRIAPKISKLFTTPPLQALE